MPDNRSEHRDQSRKRTEYPKQLQGLSESREKDYHDAELAGNVLRPVNVMDDCHGDTPVDECNVQPVVWVSHVIDEPNFTHLKRLQNARVGNKDQKD